MWETNSLYAFTEYFWQIYGQIATRWSYEIQPYGNLSTMHQAPNSSFEQIGSFAETIIINSSSIDTPNYMKIILHKTNSQIKGKVLKKSWTFCICANLVLNIFLVPIKF